MFIKSGDLGRPRPRGFIKRNTNSLNPLLNLDFSNRVGTNSNTITDTVNSMNCTLANVSHDGINDGYIDNYGLLLQSTDYVTIPTNTNPFKDKLDMSKGFSILLTTYDLVGILWRNEPGTLRLNKASSILNLIFKYIATDMTAKSTYYQSGTVTQIATGGAQLNLDSVINPSGEVNVVVVTFSPDGTMLMYLNEYRAANSLKPSDFNSWDDMFKSTTFHIHKDLVSINGNTSTKVRNFTIYNKVLTGQEILKNYSDLMNSLYLQSVAVYPQQVNFSMGDSQILLVRATPDKFTNSLSTVFTSGNVGFVTTDQDGLLTALSDGQTMIEVTSSYDGDTYTNYVDVTVENDTTPPPESSRIITGLSLNRTVDTLEVGESYSAMATSLPFDVYNDNFIIWESSAPSICKVNYGVLEGVAEGVATITAYDVSKAYSRSFEVTVTMPVDIPVLEAEIYNVVLANYGISSNNSDSLNTTNGLQSALDFAALNNYKKIIFPLGTYLVNPTVGTIELPTGMVVDFSDSIINIEPSFMTSTGYVMFLINQCSNTKLINAKIYGERDSTTVSTSVEGCHAVIIQDAYKSGLESCIISKSPGFNIQTKVLPNKVGTTGTSISKNNFENGSIDGAGLDDDSVIVDHFRSINYLNISGLGDYFMVGYNQGYYSYNYLRSRLYSIFFYDENYLFISSQMHNLQFYNYSKPIGAKYAKIVIYQSEAPTNEDSDFGAVAFIRTLGQPNKCFIKNCTIEDNFSTGIAMCGGESWLLKENTFSRNGGRMPGCDIDWEDGWETMVGDIVAGNYFNSPLGVIFSAGTSPSVKYNTFSKSQLLVYGRTQSFRIFNNNFNGKGSQDNILNAQAESYFARNMLVNVGYSTGINHSGASYKVNDLDNTLI